MRANQGRDEQARDNKESFYESVLSACTFVVENLLWLFCVVKYTWFTCFTCHVWNVLFYDRFSKQNIYVSGNSCESSSRWTGVIEELLKNYAVTAGIVPRHPVVSVYFEFLHWVFNCLLTIGQGKKRCSRTMRSQRVSFQGIQSSIYFKFLHFFFTFLLVVDSR